MSFAISGSVFELLIGRITLDFISGLEAVNAVFGGDANVAVSSDSLDDWRVTGSELSPIGGIKGLSGMESVCLWDESRDCWRLEKGDRTVRVTRFLFMGDTLGLGDIVVSTVTGRFFSSECWE